MKDWHTTAAGVIAAVGVILPVFGIPVGVGEAVSVIGLFLLGLFARDKGAA